MLIVDVVESSGDLALARPAAKVLLVLLLAKANQQAMVEAGVIALAVEVVAAASRLAGAITK